MLTCNFVAVVDTLQCISVAPLPVRVHTGSGLGANWKVEIVFSVLDYQ